MNEMCIVIIGIFSILAFLVLLYTLHLNTMKSLNHTITEVTNVLYEVQSAKVYSVTDFGAIDQHINDLVQDALDHYKIDHINHKAEDEQYVNRKEAEEMMKYMVGFVSNRITPQKEHLLKMYINIESEEDLLVYISDKVKLSVMNYMIDVNKEID